MNGSARASLAALSVLSAAIVSLTSAVDLLALPTNEIAAASAGVLNARPGEWLGSSLSSKARPATTTCLDQIADAHLLEANKDTNEGSATELLLESAIRTSTRVLFDFDASPLPGDADVLTATLSLELLWTESGSPSNPITTTVRMIDEKWDESTVTWNQSARLLRRLWPDSHVRSVRSEGLGRNRRSPQVGGYRGGVRTGPRARHLSERRLPGRVGFARKHVGRTTKALRRMDRAHAHANRDQHAFADPHADRDRHTDGHNHPDSHNYANGHQQSDRVGHSDRNRPKPSYRRADGDANSSANSHRISSRPTRCDG